MSVSWLLVVVYAARARPSPVDDLVHVAVGELGFGYPGGLVRHHCPTCGSSAHGRPWLSGVPTEPQLHLSIARCPGRSVVALTDAGPIGVDVETSGAALTRDVDEVLGAGQPGDATRRWVRAEAALKAAGRGLARAGAATDPAVGHAWTTDLDLGPGYLAALAVLATGARPEVRVIRAGAGAPSC